MREEIKKTLQSMRDTTEGMAVKEFIEEEIIKMSRLDDISGTLEEKGRIVEARQQARKILKSLFSVLDSGIKENNKIKYN